MAHLYYAAPCGLWTTIIDSVSPRKTAASNGGWSLAIPVISTYRNGILKKVVRNAHRRQSTGITGCFISAPNGFTHGPCAVFVANRCETTAKRMGSAKGLKCGSCTCEGKAKREFVACRFTPLRIPIDIQRIGVKGTLSSTAAAWAGCRLLLHATYLH